MSKFTYEKFREIARNIEEIFEEINAANETDYKSEYIEKAGRDLISIGNSLVAYIRHSNKE